MQDLEMLRARRCVTCRSTAFSATSCQQTILPPILPSDITSAYQCLAWAVSHRLLRGASRAPFEHDEIDYDLHIPNNDGYMGRALVGNRSNLLRRQQRNIDAVSVW
jgi:hypothetical protein